MSNPPPWVNPNIKRMMNKRDRAYKRAKRTGKPENTEKSINSSVTLPSNAFVIRTRNVKETMGGLQRTDLGNSIDRGIKRAWSCLKLLRAESTGIPTLFWNNRVCASYRAKAEALRQQYESVFTQGDLCATPSFGPSPHPDILEHIMAELIVIKLLQKIDTSKAAGPDLILVRILKEVAVELTPIFLTALFQQSYYSGLLPAG